MKRKAAKKKYVLKNKTRFAAVLMIPAIFASILFFTLPVMGSGGAEYETVRISEGDTLWDIASRYHANGDIRKYIYEIKSLNGLEDSFIVSGDTLKIPR